MELEVRIATYKVSIPKPGSDLKEGNKKLILAVVWQLMRAYTLSLLAQLGGDGKPIEEKEIIAWTNTKASVAKFCKNLSNFTAV